jgi:DegV family protein with EDD domain
MSKVRVITDTVACIPAEWAKKYNIRVVPTANIFIDGMPYTENKDITAKQAYELIRKDPDRFITSAITPGQVLEVFRDMNRETQEIVFISLSSALSAEYKSVSIAIDLFHDEAPKTVIHLIDSKNAAAGEGLIVLAAAKAAAQGLNLSQVLEITRVAVQQTRSMMMLETLRYVYRTGRMSKMGSRLASLLNIRPIN